MKIDLQSEQQLAGLAAGVARAWQAAAIAPLLVGLRGELGAGKTTWVRAALRGLGFTGHVRSPTYTLLEHYPILDLDIVHVDLYRLAGATDLESLGLRDWLAEPKLWLFAEWPDRAGAWIDSLDLMLELQGGIDEARELSAHAQSAIGKRALQAISDRSSK